MRIICKRDGALYPADAETAKACGVELPTVSFSDGAWTEGTPAAKAAVPAKPSAPKKPAAEPVKEPKTNG
jgi:hypothetical protein